MQSLEGLKAMVYIKYLRAPVHARKFEGATVERCWQLLKLTSRSFAAVIEELHPELRNAMMIFYLVLRGLDTIEDDVGLDNKIKLPLLRSFANEVLSSKDWTFHDSSESEKDRIVLQEFDKILGVFHNLRLDYQEIIADITRKMGLGMADYAAKETQTNYDGLKTIADYDTYCHHVAGIVGEGITRMAEVAKFASPVLAERPELYESMGQFLQKTNIIRDYREDIDDGRSFWPQEVWGKYAKSLADFKTDRVAGKHCVSNLTLLSLQRVIDCLEYLQKVEEPSLFRFCAIPQVMSIATLELVFQNDEVFEKNVKISKGLACQLILASTDMHQIYAIFRDFVLRLHHKNVPSDPSFFPVEQECAKIIQYINAHDTKSLAHQRKTQAEHPETTFHILGFTISNTEADSAKILAFSAALCFATVAVMIGVASYFGAEFPNPMKLLTGEIPYK